MLGFLIMDGVPPSDPSDVILILGGGGMMGIFVAGVLSALNGPLRKRVHSVYGTSSGADVGAYFISNQTELPQRLFIEYLTRDDFIRTNFLRYLFKLFVFKDTDIKDYVNVEYVVQVAQHSDCALDMGAFESSTIGFYVKVIDITNAEVKYLLAKTNVFAKLMATSQCGPLTTKAIEVDHINYIDGGTVQSRLDIELAKSNPDKRIIYVQPQRNSYRKKALLYPLYLLVGHAISLLYGRSMGHF